MGCRQRAGWERGVPVLIGGGMSYEASAAASTVNRKFSDYKAMAFKAPDRRLICRRRLPSDRGGQSGGVKGQGSNND